MEIGVKDPDKKPEKLSGSPEDFTVTVNKGDRVNFTDHYFIAILVNLKDLLTGDVFSRYTLYVINSYLFGKLFSGRYNRPGTDTFRNN